MRIYFIRHGQSVNNARQAGVPRLEYDSILTDIGHKQAELVAEYVATKPCLETLIGQNDRAKSHAITHLVVSPMWRTLETAKPIAEKLNLMPEVWDDIHEQGGVYLEEGSRFVGYPGKSRQEIQAAFPNYILPEIITETGWWNRDYETWDATYIRAAKVAERLRTMATQGDECLAIVTHQVFASVLLKTLLGMKPQSEIYLNLYNTGITRIDVQPNGVTFLRYSNFVGHLPPEWVTT